MAHIRIEGLEGLMELLGVTQEDLEKDMGPFAKAYEKIIEKDQTPRETLERFGLDATCMTEARAIIDFTTLQGGLKGWDARKTLLSIFMAGIFTGLQTAEDKSNES